MMIWYYNANKKQKTLIVFDDMIVNVLSNKNLNLIVTQLFITGRKLNIYLVFITQSHLAVPENIILNLAYYFAIKIWNKREFQQLVLNHSSRFSRLFYKSI